MVKVAAGVIYHEGEILISRRSGGQKLAGYWEFPGGKIEEGETPFQALVREIEEEFSLSIIPRRELIRYPHSYSFGDLELIGIEADAGSRNLVLSVHDDARWIHPSRAAGYRLAPADLLLARYLLGSE